MKEQMLILGVALVEKDLAEIEKIVESGTKIVIIDDHLDAGFVFSLKKKFKNEITNNKIEILKFTSLNNEKIDQYKNLDLHCYINGADLIGNLQTMISSCKPSNLVSVEFDQEFQIKLPNLNGSIALNNRKEIVESEQKFSMVRGNIPNPNAVVYKKSETPIPKPRLLPRGTPILPFASTATSIVSSTPVQETQPNVASISTTSTTSTTTTTSTTSTTSVQPVQEIKSERPVQSSNSTWFSFNWAGEENVEAKLDDAKIVDTKPDNKKFFVEPQWSQRAESCEQSPEAYNFISFIYSSLVHNKDSENEKRIQELPHIGLDAEGCLQLRIKKKEIFNEPLMPTLSSDHYLSRTFKFDKASQYYTAKFDNVTDLVEFLKYCGISKKINLNGLYKELCTENNFDFNQLFGKASVGNEISKVCNLMCDGLITYSQNNKSSFKMFLNADDKLCIVAKDLEAAIHHEDRPDLDQKFGNKDMNGNSYAIFENWSDLESILRDRCDVDVTQINFEKLYRELAQKCERNPEVVWEKASNVGVFDMMSNIKSKYF